MVKRMAKEAAGEEKKEKKADDALMLIYQNLEDRMKTIMGTKVSIHNKDKNKRPYRNRILFRGRVGTNCGID